MPNDPEGAQLRPDWEERALKRQHEENFRLCVSMPLPWKAAAVPLKRAADHLLAIARTARSRQMERWVADLKHPPESRPMTPAEEADMWDSGLYTISYMLFGYAIENLCKAILVHRGESSIGPDGELKGLPGNHDVGQLLEKVGVPLSPEERELVDKVSRYTKWQARYPIPKKMENALPFKRSDGTWVEVGDSLPRAEVGSRILDSLCNKVAEIAARATGIGGSRT